MKESERAKISDLPAFSCDQLNSKSKRKSPQIIVDRSFAGTYSLTEAIFSLAKSKIEAVSAEFEI